MGHLQQFEAELRTRIQAIEPGSEPDELVAWLKEQVLQSYRNGLAARVQPAGQEKTEKRGVSSPRKEGRQR